MRDLNLAQLTEVFTHQRELIRRFDEIERMNGLLQHDAIPVFIDDIHGQKRLREFAWRFVEEMCEAHGAWDQYIMSQEENESEKLEAFRIELSDCFHFLVGLCILSGITPSMLINESPYHETEEDDVSRHLLPVLYVGWAMNQLKTRPWKIAQRKTDVREYRAAIRRAFFAFIDTAGIYYDINFNDLYDTYLKKMRINQQRIDNEMTQVPT